MRKDIDPRIAEIFVTTAVSRVCATPSDRIICTRHVLREALAAAIEHAYEIGFLVGQEADLRDSTRPGSTDRPAWMDIHLDDKAAIAALQVQLWPIMVRSFHEAGYHCLGDLRWVPLDQIIQLFYIGRKTAKRIRAAIERLEGEHVG